MLRVCISTADRLQVKEVDGKKIYHVNEYYDQVIGFLDTFRGNKSYFVSADRNACFNRVKGNPSDISTDYFSPESFMDLFRVLVPFFGDKTSIVSGYDIKNIKVEEKGSALSNFKLFEVPVYITALFFILLFMLAIAARTLIHHHHQVSMMKLKAARAKTRYLYALEVEKIRQFTTDGHLRREIYEEIFASLFGSSIACRFIVFLFAVLCFYLFAIFNAGYKTSFIEIEEPPLIESYDQLISHMQSLPVFWDEISKVSDSFKFAPKYSLREVWSKLIQSGADFNSHVHGGSAETQENFELIQRHMKLMSTKSYVFIVSSLVAPLLRARACGMSSDGSFGREELRRLKIFSDLSESERLMGWAVALDLSGDRQLKRQLTLLFQSHLLAQLNDVTERNMIDMCGALLGSTKSHIRRQKNICSDSSPLGIEVDFKSMGIGYFKMFFIAILVVYFIAIIINWIECLSASPRSRSRRRPRGDFLSKNGR